MHSGQAGANSAVGTSEPFSYGHLSMTFAWDGAVYADRKRQARRGSGKVISGQLSIEPDIRTKSSVN